MSNTRFRVAMCVALSFAAPTHGFAVDRVAAPACVQQAGLESNAAEHNYSPVPRPGERVARVCMAALRTCYVSMGVRGGLCTCCFKDIGCLRGVITIGPKWG